MDHQIHHQHGHPPGRHHPCGCGPLHLPHLPNCQHFRPPPPHRHHDQNDHHQESHHGQHQGHQQDHRGHC
ncbi:unnamed protein product [Tenebrio molitor]|nr:unnamed protein product [Tenebrio molitor]